MPFPLRSVVPSWNKDVTVTISVWYSAELHHFTQQQPGSLCSLSTPCVLLPELRATSHVELLPRTTHIHPLRERRLDLSQTRHPSRAPIPIHPVRWGVYALPRCWPPQRTQPGNSLPRICERGKKPLTSPSIVNLLVDASIRR